MKLVIYFVDFLAQIVNEMNQALHVEYQHIDTVHIRLNLIRCQTQETQSLKPSKDTRKL